MANIHIECLNCKKTSLRVRTSQKVSMRTVTVLLICNNCGAKNHFCGEIVKLETPIYQERPEALRINKPLLQVDENQLGLFENSCKT